MKHFAILLSLLFLSSSVFSQERLRKLEDFNELRVNGGIKVQLYNGEGISATVSVTTGSEADVKTEVENGVLRINWKENVNANNRTATVKLYYNKLEAIKARSGSEIRTTKLLQADHLLVSSGSGSKVDLEVKCNSLEATSSAGSSLSMRGETGSQDVEVSSGASYKAEDLVSKITNIEASSGASAKVHTTKTLNAEASTGASIGFTGNPSQTEIEENKFSGGKVKAF